VCVGNENGNRIRLVIRGSTSKALTERELKETKGGICLPKPGGKKKIRRPHKNQRQSGSSREKNLKNLVSKISKPKRGVRTGTEMLKGCGRWTRS